MRSIIFLLAMGFAAVSGFAQGDQPIVLATSTVKEFTAADMSAEGKDFKRQLEQQAMHTKNDMLEDLFINTLLGLEAAAVNSTPDSLIANAKGKPVEPTEAELKKIYDQNAADLGMTFEQAKDQIAEYVKAQVEQEKVRKLFAELQTKYKASLLKDLTKEKPGPFEAVMVIGDKRTSMQEFEAKYRLQFSDLQMAAYDGEVVYLEEAILNSLIDADAKKQGIDVSEYIAKEITNKIKEYTEDERAELFESLRKRLFSEYKVKVVMPEPKPFVQTISVDDDPSIGAANAPVTIVMFTDFQCPACAQAHPMLSEAVAAFGPQKVRLVVRDFPLKGLHKNARQAAKAANAANKQGKFFEYIDVLYKNQDKLDVDSLNKYAADLKLDMKRFAADIEDKSRDAEIEKDIADAKGYGVNSTPSIFINGVKAYNISVNGFKRAIEKALVK